MPSAPVKFPMSLVQCKRGLLKAAASAEGSSKHKIARIGKSPLDRYVQVGNSPFNTTFEERKLYLFGLQQLIQNGYVELVASKEDESKLTEIFELTYGGLLAVTDPSWDLNQSMNSMDTY